jgi:hypothetical protein
MYFAGYSFLKEDFTLYTSVNDPRVREHCRDELLFSQFTLLSPSS